MVKNEQGYTLLAVLLVVLVFTVLGFSILSASIGGAKRTEIRETDIDTNLTAIKNLNEAVAYIRATIDTRYTSDMTISQYNDLINELEENSQYNFTKETSVLDIADISLATDENSNKLYDLDVNKYFTRVLQVTSTVNKQTYTKVVYITGMPSFLKYALGSREHLTLNGSVYVQEGNLYANTGLTVTNTAKYIYNGDNKLRETTLPSFTNTANQYLFLESDATKIKLCTESCYKGGSFDKLEATKFQAAFSPYDPILSEEDSEFIDVNVPKTFLEKLEEAGIIPTSTAPILITESDASNNNVKIIKRITNEQTLVRTEDGEITELPVIKNDEPGIKSYFYNADRDKNQTVFIDTNNLFVDDSRWLIIKGNATFESIGSGTMTVKANILVTGDVYIRGKVAFDSTMYVLGDTFIDNANIQGVEEQQLILMTQGKLELSKVNVPRASSINSEPEPTFIKAYLYTAKTANVSTEEAISTVYAVGSRIHIEGGLFANDNLEINAFRGQTVLDDSKDDLQFTEDQANVEASRFIIKYNNKIFSQQIQGLPKVEKLEVVTDLIEEK